MSVKDWYAQNADRITGIAKANNVDIGVAQGMFTSNVQGSTNYKGGGVADMGALYKGYQSATAQGQAAFGQPKVRKNNGAANYYNNALKEQMKVLENARKEQQRQNYISNQMALKNLPEQMNAQGLSGGMTETALMGINADYQNARHDSDNSFNSNTADLYANYADKQASMNQWQTEFDANQEAQTYAREQDAYSQRLAEAQMYAQYGDYSKLKELGINIPQEEVSGNVASAYTGRTYIGKADDTEDVVPTMQSNVPTAYTDFKNSLSGGDKDIDNNIITNAVTQYRSGKITLANLKKLLNFQGYDTDGKSIFAL